MLNEENTNVTNDNVTEKNNEKLHDKDLNHVNGGSLTSKVKKVASEVRNDLNRYKRK